MITFQETGLQANIIQAVSDLGFVDPTPIQQRAIPFLLANERDLIALAQTGTGKTAAFGLPLLHLTQPKARYVQALVLCPTRELCLQISNDLADFSRHLPQIKVAAIYGGANINKQIQQLRRGVQIVVGTPGRTLDLIRQGELKIEDLNVLVLDEADEMLDRGFKHDLDAILAAAPRDKRTWLFSATMPDEIARISRQYLRDPERIAVGRVSSGAENVEHLYFVHEKKGRYAFLRRLLRNYGQVYGIVFCRTKRKAREVARRLQRDGFNAVPLHGDMSQNARDKAMAKFRSGKARILVATDVAARGVDVDNLSHVINFDLPDVDEVYIHRSGRTGRASNSGVSIAILSEEETRRVRALENLARKRFTHMQADDVEAMAETPVPAAKPEPQPQKSAERDPAPENKKNQGDEHYKAVYDKLDLIMDTECDDPNLVRQFPHLHEYLSDIPKDELIDRFVGYLHNQGMFKRRGDGQSSRKKQRGGRRKSRRR
ncbi:MAG: DEAD/DEAH box helicase [Bacteroidota bacterium]